MTTQETLFPASDPHIGEIEETLRERGVTTVIGVDEAGRGPLAGPVFAAAFALDVDAASVAELEGLDDSKKIDAAAREAWYETLMQGSHSLAVASVSASVIDEINVLQATFRAMTRAVEQVIAERQVDPELVLVDGNMPIPRRDWTQRPIVGGDRRSLAIAAASIVAKVERDRRMCDADDNWPQYGFASHKGYGTPQHRRALREHGPCPLHRRSFAGVDTDED